MTEHASRKVVPPRSVRAGDGPRGSPYNHPGGAESAIRTHGKPDKRRLPGWVSLTEADELLPGMYEPVREHLEHGLGGER